MGPWLARRSVQLGGLHVPIRLALTIAAIATAITAGPAAGATLAHNGATRYCIVISDDAIPAEQTAASELRHYLKQVTGANFPIRTEAKVGPKAPQILVGPSGRLRSLAPDVDWAALGHDGIVVRTVGDNLLLAGGRPRGTLYAVYSFLENTVGCRWWTGTESTIPVKRALRVPAISQVYVPKLRYREAFYRDPLEHPKFAAKLKLNGHFYNIAPEYGDHYRILGWCHTFNALVPPDKYLGAHPEFYALVNGHRTPSQLCLTNDEMRRVLTATALEWISKNPTAGIISVSQNDCGGNCQCPNCKAIEVEEGSPSGPLIRFVNAVAEDIGKQYPEVLVETLAYQYTRKPPLHVRPRHNVVVRLCTIECDFARPLDSDANKTFRDDIRNWKAIAPNLYIWDYVTDFASYIQPHPNMRVLAPNLRFFTENNVIGVFEQGDSATSVGDFVRMRAWVLAHLEWNPYRDPKQLISEFLQGYYGPAAPFLNSYLNLVHDSVERNGMGLSCYNGNLSFLTLPVMNEAARLWDQAAKAVAHAPVLAARVRRDRLSLDNGWLMRYNDLKWQAAAEGVPFLGPNDPRGLAGEFIELCRTWKANNYSEGSSFESHVPALEARFASPPPEPAEFAKMPKEDVFEVQATALTLHNPPAWAKLVDDPNVSSGKAAMMDGSHTQWAVQYHVTEEQEKALQGWWKWYVVVRTEGNKTGAAFNYGIFNTSPSQELSRMTAGLETGADGRYHTYYLGKQTPKKGMYVWIAPLGNGDSVKGIYVDRVILVRDKK